ncbi:MAG TPA: amylo-alpha-1,6-glucosidase, partial [Planctomycetota bacterium]|nr:amylo-alpha-1,6-glucosidase [Planctomycetota bacterium]
ADGLGGFASGTAAGIRTRRYHALLLASAKPPTERFVLVNGLDATVRTPAGSFPISSQAYLPDVVQPDGSRRIAAFEAEPWPRWTFSLSDGTRLAQEIFVPRDIPAVAIAWRLLEARPGATLSVRPFLSGRDLHSLHHENPAFRFEPLPVDGALLWRPYAGVPGVGAISNGAYRHSPLWYRNFLYVEERARGLDFAEDLSAPGTFEFDLSKGEAVLLLRADGVPGPTLPGGLSPEGLLARLRASEEGRRGAFPSRLHRAADAYLVRRGTGRTIVAGYPWFTDWGRDTFVAMRGLCLATGRLEEAREILLEWAGAVSEGMLPNRFPDRGETPEFNSVDASLLFVVAAHEWLHATAEKGKPASPAERQRLEKAVGEILDGYARGTRYGIRADSDGLLACGASGVQLTWMDAKVGDWIVTPRIGKPVEVQALWLNALRMGGDFSWRWRPLYERGLASFREKFWSERGGHLLDVVDADHERGKGDASFRPNQILAVGGLPFPVLEGERARRVVDAVEARLWTPIGLRSLARGEPGYRPRYDGGVRDRDGAYHEGTVWPWLLGPFVEAWVRVRNGTVEAKREARRRFLEPALRHLDDAGLGHVSEIADAEDPYTPRGCPFQAWSVGEFLRLDL